SEAADDRPNEGVLPSKTFASEPSDTDVGSAWSISASTTALPGTGRREIGIVRMETGSVMNRLAIGSLALFAFAGGTSLAVAADLPMKALAYPAPPGLDASWSGFYAGVSFGGRWSDTVWTTNCIGQLA